jgi:triacylglycerol esterase/lipase EstA (alpha/beta hydrolase family)
MRRRVFDRDRARVGAAVACAGALCLALAGAARAEYAPVNKPGPKLELPAATLRAAMSCTPNLVGAGREAVLLVPPTLVNDEEAFFGYERAFTALGIPYCTVLVPHHTTIDIQVSAEYTVYAIKRMHARTGRKVQLLGWSQGGGPEPRWALRFWPALRPMVDDLVDLEAPNHGTLDAIVTAICPTECVPALYQQEASSKFIEALNSRQETFPGISYTNVYSHTSQFVQPNLNEEGTTSLHSGGGEITNVATQDICPANAADHLAYYYDPVAYALVIDALENTGPTNPARIDKEAVCGQLSMPFVPFSEVPERSATIYREIFLERIKSEPQVTQEPPLKCYVTASCPRP